MGAVGGGGVVEEVLMEPRSVVVGSHVPLIAEDGGMGEGRSDGQQIRSLALENDDEEKEPAAFCSSELSYGMKSVIRKYEIR